jgi:hypothetical protein
MHILLLSFLYSNPGTGNGKGNNPGQNAKGNGGNKAGQNANGNGNNNSGQNANEKNVPSNKVNFYYILNV